MLASNCQTEKSTNAQILARFHRDLPEAAIIAMSRLPAKRPKAMAAGACAFLHKPVKASQLKQAMHKIRKLRQES